MTTMPSGKDRYFLQAIDYLASELQREDIAALHRDARLTPTADDDVIIDRILRLHADRKDIGRILNNTAPC